MNQTGEVVHASSRAHRARRSAGWLTGGGTDGNESLTTATGIVLVVLLLIVGVTIVRIGQLTWLHLFIGLLLIGPVALKLASTSYRFVQYYAGSAPYRRKGPPEAIVRIVAPIVALSTVAVFMSGAILMFEGRADRDPWLLIHKVSFIVWVAVFAVHVLGHLPEVLAYLPGVGGVSKARELRELRASMPGLHAPQERTGHELPAAIPGRGGRSIALLGALVAGLILALVLIPDFGNWP